jgi:hypothetical protein
MARASPLAMPHSHSFRDLKVWKKSMDLVEQIYVASKRRTQTAVEEIGRMLNGLIMSLQPETE